MNEAKEILQLTTQLDTMKLVIVLLVILALALLFWVRNQSGVQKSLNDRLKAQEQNEADIRRMKQETEQYITETKAQIDKSIVDQQVKREQAQLGVLAQFSEQQQSLLTVHQQTVMVLESVSKRAGQMETFIERLSSGIEERNQIQARTTAEVRDGFNALGQQIVATVEGTAAQLRPIQAGLEHANGVLSEHTITLTDIASSNASKLDDLRTKFDTLPSTLAHTLAPIVDEWRSTNVQLNDIASHLKDTEKRLIDAIKMVVPPREVAAEGAPLNERTAAELAVIADMRRDAGVA